MESPRALDTAASSEASACTGREAVDAGSERDSRSSSAGRARSFLIFLAWGVVAAPFIYGSLAHSYQDFAACYLGHSLRSPSPYRLDLVGLPALVSGVAGLVFASAFVLLPFRKTRRFWPVSLALLAVSYVLLNHVALPMRFAPS